MYERVEMTTNNLVAFQIASALKSAVVRMAVQADFFSLLINYLLQKGYADMLLLLMT